jgi:predicted O-methyltransferase YrrM
VVEVKMVSQRGQTMRDARIFRHLHCYIRIRNPNTRRSATQWLHCTSRPLTEGARKMSSRTWSMPEPVHGWLMAHVIDEPAPLRALRVETAALPMARMQISPEQGQLMRWLVQTLGVRRALEVGTFTGYSALSIALALPPDGSLVCCDVSEEWTRIARAHWASAGVADRIDLRLAPARDTLRALLADGRAATFDLAFIDADKEAYADYYELALALLRPGGVVALDNALWSGRIADPDASDPDTVAIRDVVRAIARDPRVVPSLVPIGDGLLLATKR